MSIAELVGVTKRFGVVTALDGASFAVDAGQLVALLGPNGAGKSTALAVLLGLRRPDAGVARLFGGDPRRPEFRRAIGVTPQETAFPVTLRVRELIDLVRRHYRRPLPLEAVCERFELGSLLTAPARRSFARTAAPCRNCAGVCRRSAPDRPRRADGRPRCVRDARGLGGVAGPRRCRRRDSLHHPPPE